MKPTDRPRTRPYTQENMNMKKMTMMTMLLAVSAACTTQQESKVAQVATRPAGSATTPALPPPTPAMPPPTPAMPPPTPDEIAAKAREAQDARNLAARYVHAEVGDAKCVDYYVDAGASHAFSARCTLPNGGIIYATVDTSGPHIADLTPKPPAPPVETTPKTGK